MSNFDPVLDHFLFREYDFETYHCAHFARDVWLYLTDEDLGEYFGCLLLPRAIVSVKNLKKRKFIRLRRLETPCIVQAKMKDNVVHVGVGLNNSVIHLNSRLASYVDLNIFLRDVLRVSYYATSHSRERFAAIMGQRDS